MSTNFVPELQYYFEYFIRNSKLNFYKIKTPATFSESIISPKSFIELLFNDNWSSLYKGYEYCYREITSKSLWPSSTRNRLCVFSSSSKYFILDSTSSIELSTNIFNLKSDDTLMLDKLLEYRLSPDSTSDILIDIDSTSLETNLSLMIYLYLDLKINNNYLSYDNLTNISDENNLLELIYESYLIENMFNYISGELPLP